MVYYPIFVRYKSLFITNGLRKLSDLKKGEQGKIAYLTDDEVSQKLLVMGCLPGETVIIEKTAPLGDPIAILISGYTLSLRRQEADHIFISG
ncbi:MAG: ferrous iron transport protein A [Bacteroidetes bacterium]|nr:ferrous iron transport protein A [Bacteroidota bacterium]